MQIKAFNQIGEAGWIIQTASAIDKQIGAHQQKLALTQLPGLAQPLLRVG